MLTTLKVSSLACKCVFYRPEQNAMERLHGTEFFKVLKYKNEIYQRIELIPRVMVIKMSKMAHFFVFFAGASKRSVTV